MAGNPQRPGLAYPTTEESRQRLSSITPDGVTKSGPRRDEHEIRPPPFPAVATTKVELGKPCHQASEPDNAIAGELQAA